MTNIQVVKSFYCSICDINFTSDQELKKHSSVHEPVHEENHIETVHDGKKLHECNSCGKSFTSIENLTKHIDVKHGGKNISQQVGLNYKTLQIRNATVFHANNGYKYLKTRVNSTGTTVYLSTDCTVCKKVQH